jgi:hypothetical protein
LPWSLRAGRFGPTLFPRTGRARRQFLNNDHE